MVDPKNVLPSAGNSRLDLTSLLESVACALAGRAGASDVEVVAFTDAAVPAWIKSDSHAIKRILLSLGKYILDKPHGEDIALYAEVEKKERSEVSIRFFLSGLAGRTFPKGHAPTFLDLLKSDATRTNNGNGLNLSEAQKAAETIGSKIALADSPVKGLVFTFAIKLAEVPALTTSEHFTDLEGARILVVDDNSVTRQALVKMLESMGCRPKALSSGVEVLPTLVRGLLSNSSYRLVLLDQDMPGLTGEEVLQVIRQDKLAKDTRVVLLSPFAKAEAAEESFGSTCSGILSKPVRRADLREMIECSLGLRLNAHRSQKEPLMNGLEKNHLKKQLNILLAEDDVLSQQIASLLLARLGLSADLVFNGAEALAAAKAHDYDLIFLDMHMPVMNGPVAALEIRKLDGERKNVPIIAMTASDLLDVEERCVKAGMNGCIIKPLDLQRLSQVISDCVEGKYRVKPLPLSIPEKDHYPAETPALDLTTALPIFGNDITQYQTFLEEFLRSLPERLHRIEVANRKHEWKTIEREAHTLKGVAASVGAMKLADIASRLEGRSKGKSSELIPITKTIADIRDIIKELEKARNTLPVGITQEHKLRRGLHAGLPD